MRLGEVVRLDGGALLKDWRSAKACHKHGSSVVNSNLESTSVVPEDARRMVGFLSRKKRAKTGEI